MGEAAEMLLDGTCCECCGEYIHEGEPQGFPRYCSEECAKDRGMEYIECNDEDEDEEDECSIENVVDQIESGIIWLEMAIDDLKSLGLYKKAGALKGLVKNVRTYQKSLQK